MTIAQAHAGDGSGAPAHGQALDERPHEVQLPRDLGSRAGERAWSYAALRTLEGVQSPLEDGAISSVVAAVLALLHRYANQSDVALDLALLGRSSAPRGARLRVTLDPEPTFASLTTQAAMALEGLSELGDAAPRGSNVALTFARVAAQKQVHDIATFADEHELHFLVLEAKERVALLLAYDSGRFRASTIERLLESFATLLSAALTEPSCTLSALPLLSPAAARVLEQACDGAVLDVVDELPLRQFERLARAQPQAIAVRHRSAALSYGELDGRATRLAQHLVARGVRRESTIAVCLLPSPDVLVALLAIMKAGAIYVPLDPTHPAALVASIVEEVQPALVLTQSSVRALLPAATPSFCFDTEWDALATDMAALPSCPYQLDQACYVLYTSGTTGRPKGVVATHRNLAHYLRVARRRYGFRGDDVFCSLARYTFSISFFELLSPLTCGGSLLLLDRELVLDPARLVDQLATVTVLHAGPSLLRSVFRHLERRDGARVLQNVRHASAGGDAVPPALLEDMKRVFPRAELFVIYGCTEISCMGCTAQVDRDQQLARTLVGRPFEDVKLRVLDGRGAVVPPGVTGEVYFAGKGLARRYLHRPELTSEKFVSIDGERFYRTGDLGRLTSDGELELLGRRDFQVQVRGMRIELLGIEQTVVELGIAAQCAVVAARPTGDEAALFAFVVAPREREPAKMRRLLATRLPDYMLPQSFAVLDALPLTSNGKLDRLRLMQLAASAPAEAVRADDELWSAPEGATERVVAEAFAYVLGRARVGRDGDFFELGGHSLSAVLLVEALADRLGRSVSPALIFERSTVRALAQAIDTTVDGSREAGAAPILLSANAELPALFMLLGIHLYRALAEQLGDQYSVYGVYAASELALLHEGAPLCSVVDLAREYVAIMREKQPHGPYRLGGMSFGGIVALEAAQQLRAAGEEVELLLLLDAVLPQTRLERARRLLALGSMGAITRELGRRARFARPQIDASFTAHAGDRALRPLEEMRQVAYRAAAAAYARDARRYEGEATLVVAGERLARDPLLDPRCGFAALIEQLTVYTLACDHLGLLAAPAVNELARRVVRDARRAGNRRCVVPLRPASTQFERVA